VVLCSDALYQNDEVTQRALCDTLFGLCDRVTPGRVLFAYNFRENLAADAGFFDATDELFGDPTQHDLEDHEDIWLFEYRPARRC
jgi:nicotinamide N-methyltransferase